MFLCFLGGFNTLSCFLTRKCYFCVVFVCSLEQIGRNRLYYSSICSSSFIPLGGTVGLPHYELSQFVGRLQTCDQCVGPVLYFPELHRHSDARRHSGKQSAPTRDWGRWDTLQLRGGGKKNPPPHPNSPDDGERVPPRASVLIHHD